MPTPETWRRYQADATEHWLDTMRRSALDLDRQGTGWSDDEVVSMLTDLWDRTWQIIDVMRTPKI